MLKQELNPVGNMETYDASEFKEFIEETLNNGDIGEYYINGLLSSDENKDSLPQDETTVDISQYSITPILQPITYSGPPERLPFAGDLNFQAEINASHTHKHKYLYSHSLNRIYVNMKISFPVQFKWCSPTGPFTSTLPLYIRATTVFSEDSQAQKRVERCTQHIHDISNNGLRQEVIMNVLHSSRDMNTLGVHYCGDPSQADSWYNVLVEVPNIGHATHAYQFVCKNSCSNGINRRAIDIIFTLEDSVGKILGRQTVGARVCSCPRRDMLKEEDDFAKGSKGKRPVNAANNANGANRQRPLEPKPKRARVVEDDVLVQLPNLEVMGHRTARAGLEVMVNMMENTLPLRTDPQEIEKVNKCILNLKKYIDDLMKP